VLALAAVVAASFAVPAAADTSSSVAGALNFPWPELLPALPTAQNPQPGPVPGCKRPSPACIDAEVTQLANLRAWMGCDHRGVFATTYLVLTEALRDTVRREPRFFADPEYLYYEDALFADLYFRSVDRGARGQPVPEAWQIAFDTAARGDANAGQDMLLGINAHVQRDMPFVLAHLGLRRPDGTSRKLDHDKVNEVLQRAYGPVVETIARDYDPLLYTTNASWNPLDDVGGLELVKTWREGVWRNAERLLNAQSASERQQVAQSIEDNAAAWARQIAGPQVPGYRAQRDAYCAAHFPPPPPAAAPSTLRRPRARCAPRHGTTSHRPAARRHRTTSRRRAAHRRRAAKRPACSPPRRPTARRHRTTRR
jgi:hypothetical protein